MSFASTSDFALSHVLSSYGSAAGPSGNLRNPNVGGKTKYASSLVEKGFIPQVLYCMMYLVHVKRMGKGVRVRWGVDKSGAV